MPDLPSRVSKSYNAPFVINGGGYPCGPYSSMEKAQEDAEYDEMGVEILPCSFEIRPFIEESDFEEDQEDQEDHGQPFVRDDERCLLTGKPAELGIVFTHPEDLKRICLSREVAQDLYEALGTFLGHRTE